MQRNYWIREFLSACRAGCGRATWMSRKKRRDRSRLLLTGHTNLTLEFHVNCKLAIHGTVDHDSPRSDTLKHPSPGSGHGYRRFPECPIRASQGITGITRLECTCPRGIQGNLGMDSFPLPGRWVRYQKTVITNQGVHEVDRAVGSHATIAHDAAFNFAVAINFEVRSSQGDTGGADSIIKYFTLD